MTYPHIHAALGHERQKTLLTDAEAARTARQARLHRRQVPPVARGPRGAGRVVPTADAAASAASVQRAAGSA